MLEVMAYFASMPYDDQGTYIAWKETRNIIVKSILLIAHRKMRDGGETTRKSLKSLEIN